jgi:exopolysaccharide biosynthesis polyprenyl glycosylphosphotransferase
MSSNGIVERHWFRVGTHFLTDTAIYVGLFALATFLRLGAGWEHSVAQYFWALLPGALTFSCAIYICGLYAPRPGKRSLFGRGFAVLCCLAFSLLVMLALFYLNYSSRVGRGVMMIGVPSIFAGVMVHHMLLAICVRRARPRVALIVRNPDQEREGVLLCNACSEEMELVGAISYGDYTPGPGLRHLGSAEDIKDISQREQLDRVLCSQCVFSEPGMHRQFWKLRYSGVMVMPLVSLCEEVLQAVPLELVNSDWLLAASGSPEMVYIKKVKRGFDIVCSLIGLVLSSPLFLVSALWIKIVSPGPVFYRQKRLGKFGREIDVIKLRTMRLDAESGGAVWASEKDPRVIPGGGILRKYRIDEIPQLWNVLRGEMSLVGPRPERPEFVKQLSEVIDFYPERLMIQPGLTGWAQVNYPYGSCVEDARRKLEYDLYYMKHMGLFLDVFILLDTIRIILTGGIRHNRVAPHPIRKAAVAAEGAFEGQSQAA